MTDVFDPYHKWLGIPLGRRPPNHYEMLGIALYESDLDVIENAADRRMSHIKTFASGPQAKISQLLLNQLSEARVCLCSDQSRKAYDLQLQKQLAATGGSEAGTSSSRRAGSKARSGGSGLRLGLTMLAASLIVCYLAFTHGWASFNNLQAANNEPNPEKISDGKSKPKDPPKTGGHDEPVTVVVEPPQPEPPTNDQAIKAAPKVEDPPEEVAVPEPEQPANPPGPEYYSGLDRAFTALSDYDYVAFEQYRLGVKKLASDQQLDAKIVDANLKTLDEIGDGYRAIWRLVAVAIPKLRRNKTLNVPEDKRYRIVTAVSDRLQVECRIAGKRVKENYLRKAGDPPIYENMPTSLATHLAKLAIKKRMLKDELDLGLAARGADFFRDLNFDQLPVEPRTRWSVVEEEWLSTAGEN